MIKRENLNKRPRTSELELGLEEKNKKKTSKQIDTKPFQGIDGNVNTNRIQLQRIQNEETNSSNQDPSKFQQINKDKKKINRNSKQGNQKNKDNSQNSNSDGNHQINNRETNNDIHQKSLTGSGVNQNRDVVMHAARILLQAKDSKNALTKTTLKSESKQTIPNNNLGPQIQPISISNSQSHNSNNQSFDGKGNGTSEEQKREDKGDDGDDESSHTVKNQSLNRNQNMNSGTNPVVSQTLNSQSDLKNQNNPSKRNENKLEPSTSTNNINKNIKQPSIINTRLSGDNTEILRSNKPQKTPFPPSNPHPQISHDIESLQSLVKVHEEEAIRLRSILDRLQDVVIVFDLQGSIRFVSSACLSMLNWTRDELVGKNIDKIIYEASTPNFRIDLHQRLFAQSQRELTITEQLWYHTLKCKNGSFLPAEGRGQAWEQGNAIEVVMTYRELAPKFDDFQMQIQQQEQSGSENESEKEKKDENLQKKLGKPQIKQQNNVGDEEDDEVEEEDDDGDGDGGDDDEPSQTPQKDHSQFYLPYPLQQSVVDANGMNYIPSGALQNVIDPIQNHGQVRGNGFSQQQQLQQMHIQQQQQQSKQLKKKNHRLSALLRPFFQFLFLSN